MKIQYCADLHLEFQENKEFLKNNPLLPKGDILLLAGDIVPFKVLHKHNDFFDYVSGNFETTWWVPGNHEYYSFDLANKQGCFNEKIRNNVFLVNNFTHRLPGIKFIFSTLWTRISPANEWNIQQRLSDFHVIGFHGNRMRPHHYNRIHTESLNFIKTEVSTSINEKIIVVTHHVPTYIHYPEKYKGDVLNEAFAIELLDFIERSKIEYWIFGHHHHNAPDFKIGSTNMRTNQLGYVKYDENAGFDCGKIFEI